MQVEDHFLDEVGDVAVFRASDIHGPVMRESLGTGYLFHRGSMSEFYLYLYCTVLEVLDKVFITTEPCTISRLIGYFFLFLTGKKTDSLQTSNVWWSLDNTIHLIVQPAKHHLLIVMIHNIIGMAFTKSFANQQFEQLIINIHHSHTCITHLTNW